jgi:hypothetical protein
MRTVTLLSIMIVFFGLAAFAGENSAPVVAGQSDPAQYGVDPGPQSPAARKLQKQQEKALNQKRQEELKRDTDKLLQLATELKQYVDKTNEDILSIDVARKATEIEKLAKSVQKKALDQ